MMLPGFPMPLIMGGGGFDPSTPIGMFVPGEGGYYIGTIVDGGGTFALFTAPKSTGQNNSIQWKTSDSATAGTDSLTNGLANCNSMNNSTHPAAQWARGRNINGFTDWYMPAINELNVMFLAKGSIAGPDSIDADSTYYWSSTQFASITDWARVQKFDDGGTQNFPKRSNYRLRVVRRLEL